MAEFPDPPPVPDAKADNNTPDVPFVGTNAVLAPSPQASPWAVPSTLYVWLLLLVVSLAAPRVMDGVSAQTKKVRVAVSRDTGLTSPDFEKYLAAETSAKGAFAMQGLQDWLQNAGGKSPRSQNAPADLLGKAVVNYRELLQTKPSPNLARRILLLEHAQRKPLDEKILTGPLKSALTRDKVPTTQQNAEMAMWRGMYGDFPQTDNFVTQNEKRIKAMNLRFYEARALADLYQAAGQKKQAQAAEETFRQSASRFAGRQALVNGTLVVAFLFGIGFLVVFIVAASTKNWPLVRRIATQNQPLGWGDLLDVFVFYLMTVFVARPLVSLLAPRFLPHPTMQTALVLSAGLYLATALISTAYLASVLKRRGTNWSAVCFRAPNGILSNVAYGFAGYCATLPFSVALGSLSHLIFRHNPDTAPNPILPLIAGEHDPVGRVVIYLLAAVAAPLFEELFFRGVLFSGLRTRFGWVVSGLISGACFALVHPMQDWLPIFGLGFVFAAMREMRQSLVPGMVAHFCQNSFAFIALSVLFGD